MVSMDDVVDFVQSIARLRQPFTSRLLAGDLAQHLARLKQVIPDSERMRGASASYGLIRVGLVLGRASEAITMGELSKASGLPLSTATHVMDRLVETGYAQRFPEPGDRRIVRVALSKSGLELYESLFVMIQERVTLVLASFTKEEWAELRRLLRKFSDAVREAE